MRGCAPSWWRRSTRSRAHAIPASSVSTSSALLADEREDRAMVIGVDMHVEQPRRGRERRAERGEHVLVAPLREVRHGLEHGSRTLGAREGLLRRPGAGVRRVVREPRPVRRARAGELGPRVACARARTRRAAADAHARRRLRHRLSHPAPPRRRHRARPERPHARAGRGAHARGDLRRGRRLPAALPGQLLRARADGPLLRPPRARSSGRASSRTRGGWRPSSSWSTRPCGRIASGRAGRSGSSTTARGGRSTSATSSPRSSPRSSAAARSLLAGRWFVVVPRVTVRRSSYRSLASLQRDLSRCRACVEAGFPLESWPVARSLPRAARAPLRPGAWHRRGRGAAPVARPGGTDPPPVAAAHRRRALRDLLLRVGHALLPRACRWRPRRPDADTPRAGALPSSGASGSSSCYGPS